MLPSEYLEKGWTQCADAKDCNGKKVKAISKNAVAWCMLGSIQAALPDTNSKNYAIRMQLYNQIRKIINSESILYYNDHKKRTREEVIAVMKQAEQKMGWNNVT